MKEILSIEGCITDNVIKTGLSNEEIIELLLTKIIIIKNLFKEDELQELKNSVINWSAETKPATQDDFNSNYHSLKARLSNIQKTPHVFHDFNFNDFEILSSEFKSKMYALFEPLRIFYNSLTGYEATLGVKKNNPYFHPQFIHYPVGGGFFGRHSHNLMPQKIGFILSMSKYGKDYSGGGTCFVIDDKVVDIEEHHDIGDLCMFRFDLDHWVKQSPLNDKFTWEADRGRWVATLAYFNPYN